MQHLLLSWNILLFGKWQFSESQNTGTSFSFAWGDILCNLKHPFSWPVLFQDFDSFSYVISTYTPPQSNPTPSEATQGLSTHLTMNRLLSPGDSRPLPASTMICTCFPALTMQLHQATSSPQQCVWQCSCFVKSCFVIAAAVVAAVQTNVKDTAGKSAAAFLNLNLKSCNKSCPQFSP